MDSIITCLSSAVKTSLGWTNNVLKDWDKSMCIHFGEYYQIAIH